MMMQKTTTTNTTTVLKIAKNLVPYYVSSTLLYGFVRSVTYDFEAKKKYWNENRRSYEIKDRLLVDNLGRIASKTLSAVVMWPVMLGDDFACLECAMYDKDPAEYGIKSCCNSIFTNPNTAAAAASARHEKKNPHIERE